MGDVNQGKIPRGEARGGDNGTCERKPVSLHQSINPSINQTAEACVNPSTSWATISSAAQPVSQTANSQTASQPPTHTAIYSQLASRTDRQSANRSANQSRGRSSWYELLILQNEDCLFAKYVSDAGRFTVVGGGDNGTCERKLLILQNEDCLFAKYVSDAGRFTVVGLDVTTHELVEAVLAHAAAGEHHSSQPVELNRRGVAWEDDWNTGIIARRQLTRYRSRSVWHERQAAVEHGSVGGGRRHAVVMGPTEQLTHVLTTQRDWSRTPSQS
eukprot:CAMPEP_0174759724 /NCGR_PEP_ID=MMETSP1094-20130205/108412_1 /TAXON_ID=156173 /ORGANISM="Chrysochromulina brevifilum, Strain UTEX LB 985" /LENGTH=271 /DNA_ID=CAMNT_0015965663 /DNA_START=1021 /DNA_END=1837 /DNA_ORIENTATION=+